MRNLLLLYFLTPFHLYNDQDSAGNRDVRKNAFLHTMPPYLPIAKRWGK